MIDLHNIARDYAQKSMELKESVLRTIIGDTNPHEWLLEFRTYHNEFTKEYLYLAGNLIGTFSHDFIHDEKGLRYVYSFTLSPKCDPLIAQLFIKGKF